MSEINESPTNWNVFFRFSTGLAPKCNWRESELGPFYQSDPPSCDVCIVKVTQVQRLEWRCQIRTRIRPHHLPHSRCDLKCNLPTLWIGNWLKLDFGFGTSHMFHHPMSGQKHSNIIIQTICWNAKYWNGLKYKTMQNPKYNLPQLVVSLTGMLRWKGVGEFKQIRGLPEWTTVDQVLFAF